MTSHSSDGSCSLSGCCSGCSQESGTPSQGRQKRRVRKKNKKKEKVNRLVIPVGTSDKTIKIYVPGKEPTYKIEDDTVQSKSSITRMIDDFHRNLPPAEKLTQTISEEDSAYQSTNYQSNPNTVSEKTGTVASRTSMWSVKSSVASFDYHDIKGKHLVQSKEKSK